MKRTDDDAMLRATLAHDDANIANLERMRAAMVARHAEARSDLQRAQQSELDVLSRELAGAQARRSRIVGQLVDLKVAEAEAARSSEGR